jgi:hypothetical protein
MATSRAAMGTRGDAKYADDRSITARKYAEGLLQKDTRSAAITRTRNWLASGEPLEVVLTPDGRTFAVPRPAAEALRAETTN